jgi:hypothetical protein
MSAALRAARVWVPGPLRRAALRRLLAVTAQAFDRPAPPVAGLSEHELLATFTRCTAGWSEEAIGTGRDLRAIQDRLRDGAAGLGAALRRRLRLSGRRDVVDAARVVYRLLDIDFTGTQDGRVIISRCSFSSAYSPAVCRVMSALDAGLLAGLSGGDRLRFTARITEGAPACLATLTTGEART